MGYLAYLIALVKLALSDTRGMTLNQGIDFLLDKAVPINYILFWVVLVIWIIALVVVGTMLFSKDTDLSTVGTGCGCQVLFLILLPLIQFIIWRVNVGMANSWGPEGVTDPVKFWVLVAITILLGSG